MKSSASDSVDSILYPRNHDRSSEFCFADRLVILNKDRILWQKFPRDKWSNAVLSTGNPGSVIVPQLGSSKITVFVWGKNTILEFVGNTKYKSMKLTLLLVVVVLIAPTKFRDNLFKFTLYTVIIYKVGDKWCYLLEGYCSLETNATSPSKLHAPVHASKWGKKNLSSVSLGAILTPKRNWRQCLCKCFGVTNKEYYGMLLYFVEWLMSLRMVSFNITLMLA